MLAINSLSIKGSNFAVLSEIRANFGLWLDSGFGAISTPWNDLATWSE
jgi:hypothetical protein